MREKNIGLLFLALGLLAIGQVVWWSYLLINPTGSSLDAANFRVMIQSEGLFFVFVWGLGMLMAYRYFLKQMFLQKAQKDFIAAITHELKTPLTNIRLCLDTLERPGINDEMKTKYISRAHTSVDRLVNSVETILTLSSAEERKLETQTVELTNFVNSCIEAAKSHLTDEKTEIVLTTDIEEYVQLPPEEGRLIIQNLLDNAIKYSANSQVQKIEVSIEAQGDRVLLKIRDHGVGLSAEELRKAFDAFWRSEWAISQAKSGTGLGLTLTKSLCERAGLKVELQSEGRNKGTTALLWIPREKSQNG